MFTITKHHAVLLLMLTLSQSSRAVRNIHRPIDRQMPKITTFWTDEPKSKHYSLRSYCLQEWAIFGLYDKHYFNDHLLSETVSYHYRPEESVSRETLSKLIEEFLDQLSQIHQKKAHDFYYKDFIILKDRDYNYKLHCGLIILKFKNYPFVVKLFIETPSTFTQPFIKGFEPCWFFCMSGGINRYLSGFTRIPNLEKIRTKIEADTYWSQRISLPRKWYWLPSNVRRFTIIGNNMGGKKEQAQTFPSTYGIICDEIALERQLHNYYRVDRIAIRDIMNFLGNHLDPHINNFYIEKDTGKIVIIDTELFSTMVGLHQEMVYTKSTSWYCKLANKCVKDCFFRTKKNRRDAQKPGMKPILV